MAYQAGRYDEEERRWRRPCAAATRSVALLGGGADWHRPAALFVARVLVFEYATLLVPFGARHCAPRGCGD